MNWEERFVKWSKPPSQTEEQKAENARKIIVDAIRSDPVLKNKNINILTQGSYRNNTNVKLDSDVDVCIMLKDTIYFDLPPNRTKEDYGISGSDYHFPQYKNEVENALKRKFGNESNRGNKSIQIHSNTYRINADAVPCFEYRLYDDIKFRKKKELYEIGIKFKSDKGDFIINWPNQHYEHGVYKNKQTDRRYKRTVRIMKNIRNEMLEEGNDKIKDLPSFLIECLSWNVPDQLFKFDKYTDIIQMNLEYILENVENLEDEDQWLEVNMKKYLFELNQKWHYEEIYDKIYSIYKFLEFKRW